jgi:hypothetical protein
VATAATTGSSRWVVPALLGGLCLLAYAPGLTSPLTHYDDSIYLYANKVIGIPGLPGLLTQWDSSRAWSGDFVEYFPLRDTVYWAVYQVWGLTPTPYHVVSLLFHLLATLAAWRLALRLGLSPWAAAMAAAIFAVHPVHIESVVWAAGLKDPMYTALMMGGLVAYARYREGGGARWYALALVAFSGAMLVKAMAMVMVVLMLAMERWVGRPTPWPEVLKRLAGPAVYTALWLAQIILIGRAANVISFPHGGTWLSHAVLTAWAQVLYLQQALLPYNVRFIYCFPPATGWTDWRLLVAVLVAAGVVALVFRWRRAPLKLFALSWHFACLLPVSNLVPFPTVMQDRYLYAAVFGVALLAAGLLEALDVRLRRVVAPAVLLTLALVTAARTSLWQDESRLWDEPDLDPACMLDRSFPAAQTHLLHFWSARDPEVKLAAYERTVASPGFLGRFDAEVCGSLGQAIHLAVQHRVPERAGGWAVMAAQRCKADAYVWNAISALEMHRRPRKAAQAADKAYRLDSQPTYRAMQAVTHLEAGDPRGRELTLEAVTASPAVACPVVEQFASEVSPELREKLRDILDQCPRAPAPTMPPPQE